MRNGLTASQVAFCGEIVRQRLNGESDNASAAYRLAYPDCSDKTCQGAASQTFHKPHIQAEIQRQLQAHGITKEYINGALIDVLEHAKAKEDLLNLRGAAMDLAKLCGFIVDKQEVTEVESTQRDAIREIVNRALQPAPTRVN